LQSEKGKYPELQELVNCFDDFKKLAIYLESGEEPTAVLCHGDFCSNNILFSEGLAVKFVDLQKASYASPAMDLSFFLYLNTSPETREKHWDDLLESYLGRLDPECSPSRDLVLKGSSPRNYRKHFIHLG
jgi:thiamine kinase-like enzyme